MQQKVVDKIEWQFVIKILIFLFKAKNGREHHYSDKGIKKFPVNSVLIGELLKAFPLRL